MYIIISVIIEVILHLARVIPIESERTHPEATDRIMEEAKDAMRVATDEKKLTGLTRAAIGEVTLLWGGLATDWKNRAMTERTRGTTNTGVKRGGRGETGTTNIAYRRRVTEAVLAGEGGARSQTQTWNPQSVTGVAGQEDTRPAGTRHSHPCVSYHTIPSSQTSGATCLIVLLTLRSSLFTGNACLS